ncbi:MAG: AAA-like domain-containing protein [Blastocatellia bacterium]|nr:AAA-like domain-containing protein [Blastocatellia bacterium]
MMKNQPSRSYFFGPFRLDPARRELVRGGEPVRVGDRLFDLLVALVERHGRRVDRNELLDLVWGVDSEVGVSNLPVSINGLRKILGKDEYIETVNHGYRFAAEVRTMSIPEPPPSHRTPPGGAMRLDSPMYVARETDEEFYAAIEGRQSVVLVKGPRQIGKSSLLARGLQRARGGGARVVLTDFQHLAARAFESLDSLLLTLSEMIAVQLKLAVAPHQTWSEHLGPSTNFECFIRDEVLVEGAPPLVWGMDEVDRVFPFDFASEFFGLFRSWHNLRALEPDGPMQRMTQAMAYATEAHLFITDLNQSPFNIGVRLRLEDFTPEQVAELNDRHGRPLRDQKERERFYRLIGGHPYLAHRGLHEMATRSADLAAIESRADLEEGIFGDHLRRLEVALERGSATREALRVFLREGTGLSRDAFYHLRTAGVLSGDSPGMARLRCELYDRYLRRALL